jgi:hypothetical protein
MPPRLVLVLCILWIVYVLYREIQSKPEVSLALWLPTSVDAPVRLPRHRCLVFTGRGLRRRARYDPNFLAVLMARGDRGLDLSTAHLGSGCWSTTSSSFSSMDFMVASTVWSIAPGVTAYKLIRPFGDLMMALIVVTERNPKMAIITMLRRCTILLIPLSVALIRYFPDHGRGLAKHWGPNPWLGVGTHKNTLGQLCHRGDFYHHLVLFSIPSGGRTSFQVALRSTITSFSPTLVMILFLLNGGGHSRSVTSMMCIAVGLFLHVGDRPVQGSGNID